MAWRVADSLDVLLAQLNALAPARSRAADGSIGDAAHAARTSDHNPWFVLAGQPLVTARDFTHDPAGGLGGQLLADALVAGRDPRLKYVIWNRRILDTRPDCNPWRWTPYGGPNPHQHHVHVSVVADARCQLTTPWALPGLVAGETALAAPAPALRRGNRGPTVAALQRWLNAYPWAPALPLLDVDGVYGPATVDVVRGAQAQCGVTGPDADGTIVGPRTNRAFWARGYRGR